jgi:hypothetical protein
VGGWVGWESKNEGVVRGGWGGKNESERSQSKGGRGGGGESLLPAVSFSNYLFLASFLPIAYHLLRNASAVYCHYRPLHTAYCLCCCLLSLSPAYLVHDACRHSHRHQEKGGGSQDQVHAAQIHTHGGVAENLIGDDGR